MDLHDTLTTLRRVNRTMNFANRKDPVSLRILTETSMLTVNSDEIRKLAHAGQWALDKLEVLLPDFIIEIAHRASEKLVKITGINVNMLVNNGSCARCDATISGAAGKGGWLERMLIASIHKSMAYSVDKGKVVFDQENLNITVAVSSEFPYNVDVELDGRCFFTRGGIVREVLRRKKSDGRFQLAQHVDSLSRKDPILKIYE